MSLNLFNNISNNRKENNSFQNLIKELSDYIDREKNMIKQEGLKQENQLYQVVEIDVNGVYLQNIKNNRVLKETDISKELLNKIGEDSVLRYKNGRYIYEEELTQKFMDSLVEITQYEQIKENFVKESNILSIDPDTIYTVENREETYSILSYKKERINVPNELIPFWTKKGETLYYENGKFNRKI